MKSVVRLLARHFVPVSIVMYFLGFAENVYSYLGTGKLSFLNWKLTQYHMTYSDFGFVKRGLVGSILKPALSRFDGWQIGKEFLIMSLDALVFLSVLYIVSRTIKALFSEDSELAIYLKVAIALAPIGFVQFSFDTGRFDHLTILIFLLGAILLHRGQYLFCGIALAIGILIHEAVFIFGVPVLLAYALFLKLNVKSLACIFLPIVISAASVVAFGNSSIDPASVLPIEMAQGAAVWSRGLFEPALGLGPLQYALLLFYTAAPYLFLFVFYRSNGIQLDLMFLSALAPLSLFAMGIDYFRWTQLIFVSVVAVILLKSLSGHSKLKTDTFPAARYMFIAYVLPLGPIGDVSALPFVALTVRILTRS